MKISVGFIKIHQAVYEITALTFLPLQALIFITKTKNVLNSSFLGLHWQTKYAFSWFWGQEIHIFTHNNRDCNVVFTVTLKYHQPGTGYNRRQKSSKQASLKIIIRLRFSFDWLLLSASWFNKITFACKLLTMHSIAVFPWPLLSQAHPQRRGPSRKTWALSEKISHDGGAV